MFTNILSINQIKIFKSVLSEGYQAIMIGTPELYCLEVPDKITEKNHWDMLESKFDHIKNVHKWHV